MGVELVQATHSCSVMLVTSQALSTKQDYHFIPVESHVKSQSILRMVFRGGSQLLKTPVAAQQLTSFSILHGFSAKHQRI